ncbi:carboxylesterase/lipase family protein [Sphingomonas panacisoli]|uniref:Carboxylic ester hydrolase n=1 Tax=Sphingomonas panacisoli TaxID=1813879 RepID=A0A5B8LFC1_9SPHN|nr:carboxylesterase family protein [Sphingomonas panacisoli]QDZ06781.1 carboxylesterase/lipase family protein [Sphingomonas panacisoli]
MEIPVIQLPAGAVRGATDGVIDRFVGIPYAAPPVGERRFAAPQPVEPWSGERDATLPGSNAPQRVRAFPGLDVYPLVGTGWVEGDDYLTLNVLRLTGSAGPLPVMVFIHGGGFVVGSKDAAVQDGASFARDGIVYVAINYRMGIDGFLPIPDVPTNLGLRDQIAALTWVRDNIAAFGGDPSNVTVFGESAGGMSTANLIASPLAKGLFRRAIVESGHGGMTRDIPVARRLVDKLAGLLGVSADKAGFASVPPSQATLDAVEKISQPTARIDLRDEEGREPVFGISRFVPVHGDDVLPVKPLDALKAGAGAEIDLLIGTNAEEMNLYLVPTGVRAKVGRILAWLALRKSIPRAWAILKAYGMGGDAKPGMVLNAAMNDLVFRWPARRFAEEHQGKTHLYEFDWRSPMFGGELGAAHGMELPFVFDCLPVATGPEGLCGTNPPQDLATRIHGLWVQFAKTGALPWPEFDRDTRQVYRLEAGEASHEPVMPAAAFLP